MSATLMPHSCGKPVAIAVTVSPLPASEKPRFDSLLFFFFFFSFAVCFCFEPEVSFGLARFVRRALASRGAEPNSLAGFLE